MTKRPVLLATAIALALVCGIIIGLAVAPDPEASRPIENEPRSPALSESLDTALRFTQAIRLLPDEEAYLVEILPLVDPSLESEVKTEADETARFLTSRYGFDAKSTFAPVLYDIESSGNHDVIRLWGPTVIRTGIEAPLEVSYVTVTLRLRESNSEWFVVERDSSEGPSPGAATSRLGGFESLPLD